MNSTPLSSTDDNRWLAVTRRDKTQDGEFVYAVRSTGIYCRPSCPSRTAKRENVEYFDTTYEAKASGYRSCLRCKPDDMPLEHQQNDRVLAACRAMESSEVELGLTELAARAGLNPHHFHRLFKRVTGLTPKAYSKAVRNRRLQTALQTSNNVTDAIFDAGYNAASRFYETDAQDLGMSPSDYRDGAPNHRIRHACEPCALGVLLVAATAKGVCAIEFGDSAHDLVARLRTRFPKATFESGDGTFREWVGKVLAKVDRPTGVLDLPLDIQGTVFQRQVWAALRDIPTGETQSYSEVATRIGKPRAVRAVASACAKNTLAMAAIAGA
jgi:AraC family transcriptional regulator of adaptative response/methylated-DNA-[protein]-cysteine methyltransferase